MGRRVVSISVYKNDRNFADKFEPRKYLKKFQNENIYIKSVVL